MSQQQDDNSDIGSGLNSSVEYQGRLYHVQTQCSTRDDPVIESMVFQDGRVLVRITSSQGDVARQLGFTEDDGLHLVELQHADLIRKIRHGMLRSDDAAAPAEGQRLVDDESSVANPAEIDDPSVQQLLRGLDPTFGGVAPSPAEQRRGPAQSPPPPATPRRRRFRLVIRIILPF